MTQSNSTASNVRWKPFDSIEELRHDVCDAIMQASQQAINKNGQFSIVLAGGNTPRTI